MNVMIKFNKEIFNNISKRCDNFNKISLSKNNIEIEELNINNIENKNVWVEFLDDKKDIRQSTFLLHIDKNIFSTNDITLFENDRFLIIKIFDFYSYLYEELYNYIYNNIPFKC